VTAVTETAEPEYHRETPVLVHLQNTAVSWTRQRHHIAAAKHWAHAVLVRVHIIKIMRVP
jgi:hypothetical protein